MVRTIVTPNAPAAVGPYSHAAVAPNGLVFVSGCIGMDLQLQMVSGGVEAETKQVLANMNAVLEASGSDKHHVLKCNIFLTSMADFAAVNKIYEEFFEGHKPARACVAVAALPRGAVVEIECTAVQKKQ